MKFFTLTLTLISFCALGDSKTFEENEQQVIDYSNIKKVLINDDLEREVGKKKEFIQKVKSQRKKINRGRYNYPNEKDFYAILTEYWLVSNAQELKWDFPKPAYGIKDAFEGLLEKMGYFNLSFKVLILNTPNLSHFALPGEDGEVIFLLSLPFIKNLDLTKVDISLLLFEDLMRHKEGYFIKNLNIKNKMIGSNFQNIKLPTQPLKEYLKSYDKVIRETGFNFQQQFEVTKKMDALLKSSPLLWNAYYKLIVKIDKFIELDSLFKHILKIYPSPELQLKWLAPPKKEL